MKKIFYFSVIFGLSHYLIAQVGIGTNEPKATLHIVAKSNSEDPLKIEGLNPGKNEDILSVDNQGVVKKIGLSELSGRLIYSKSVKGTEVVEIHDENVFSDAVDIPGLSITYKPTVNCTAVVTVYTLPTGNTFSVDLILKLNNNFIEGCVFAKSEKQQRTIMPVSFTKIVDLDANQNYTFKVCAKQTFSKSTVTFNSISTLLTTAPSGVKSKMTILFYSR